MKFVFIVFFSLLAAACANATLNPNASPAANGNSSQTDDLYAAQTKRVTTDEVFRSLVKSFEKKYKVSCTTPQKDDSANSNPRWTCLNNMACSYKIVAACFKKSDPKHETLELEVAGFDDGTTAQVQAMQVTYISN